MFDFAPAGESDGSTEDENKEACCLSKLREEGFNTQAGIAYCAGDEDFYIEMLQTFAGDYEEKSEAIKADFEKKDIADYQIRVHALKSTAKTIGADELSALALAQETAAKEQDTEAIEKDAGRLLSMYSDVVGKIRKATGC